MREQHERAIRVALRGRGRDVLAVEPDRAGARPQEAADGLHDGGLAGAVEPDQPGDDARFRLQGDAAQDVDVHRVAGGDVAHLEQRAHAAAPPR